MLRVVVVALAVVTTVAQIIGADTASQASFSVPTLVQIRDILAQLEAPIISTLVQRFALPVNSDLYQGSPSTLQVYLATRETLALVHGRYKYGTLEYAFTFPTIVPDKTTAENTFPPGIFHQDSFVGNSNLTAFHTQILVPLLNATTSPYFFHLANSTTNATPDPTRDDAALSLDVTLLQLLSNRAHIGKVVAESKFAGDPVTYTNLIQAKNSTGIRTLLTNTTQETQVLLQADTAAVQLTNAWVGSGALVSSTFQDSVRNAAAKTFRNLIDITTEIEIEYLLARLN